MKQLLKKIVPASWLSLYHKTMAILADYYYKHPSDKMIIIGVTGTKGKSTTCNILWHLLEEAGYKTGIATTSNFRIHKQEWVNKFKMTMLGRFQLQKLLGDMTNAGCQYAIVETSSEGIKQWRHLGINYDIGIFLNLSPEHIESHGGFENYKKAKAQMFKALTKKTKRINGQEIKKMIFANSDDEQADYYLQNNAEIKITYGTMPGANIQATDLTEYNDGIAWRINNTDYSLQQLGKFNIYNALPAVAMGIELGLNYVEISEKLRTFAGMAGRMEKIEAGQDYKVIVDYCYEPKSLEFALQSIKKVFIKNDTAQIIAVSGPTGGGRDIWRRPVMGEILAKYCFKSIITTDDPYDDDPGKIADEMIAGLVKQGKKENEHYFKIIDRREAIKKAFSLAKPGDVVLLAGKGADPVMAVAKGRSIVWDDRQVARELLHEKSA